MAFAKVASAVVTKPNVFGNYWKRVRTAGKKKAVDFKDILPDFSPERYLLTHCTIVCSVDTEKEPKNKKGWEYVIKKEHTKYVNNNHDSWERNLLLATFATFIGGENYVEHIQIPELSKGKIVDAVARDIGDTIYIDILVATDRKHSELVSDIITGKISTLSMGCTVQYTICTKCGNVAKDETELCVDIKYHKGASYVDKDGVQRIIAELCGHSSDPTSVKFIEASWVKEPAFPGAVMRNIVTVAGEEESMEKAAAEFREDATVLGSEAFDMPTDLGANTTDMLLAALTNFGKVASKILHQKNAGDFDFGGGGDDEEKKKDKPAEPEKPVMDALVEELSTEVRKRVKNQIKDEITPKPTPKPAMSEDHNDEVVHSRRTTRAYTEHRRPNIPVKVYGPEYEKRVDSYVKTSMAKRAAFDAFVDRFAGQHPFIAKNSKMLFESVWTLAQNNGRFASLAHLSGKEILLVDWFLEHFTARKASYRLAPECYRALVVVGGTKNFNTPTGYLLAVRAILGRKLTPEEARGLVVKGRLYSMGRSDEQPRK